MESTFEKVAAEDVREHAEKDLIQVEVIHAGATDAVILTFAHPVGILAAIRQALALEEDIELFERDQDEAFRDLKGRKAIRLIAHKSKQILVKVRYEHRIDERLFAPSKTVFRVLQWAVGKKGFNLDPTSAARANLILPHAESPLPRDAVIGSFVHHGHKELVLDLTLKDFTNG